jgi:cytochrome c5
MRKLLVTLLTAASIFAVQASEPANDEIIDRIKPVGEVYIAGAEPEPAANAGPKSGDQVYQASCSACHGAGVMGAPKYGDAAAWSARTAQGMDVLLEHAIKGFNAMPAKGGCMACSDDEIKAAIEYMLEGSK